jgi:hypothetical protein
LGVPHAARLHPLAKVWWLRSFSRASLAQLISRIERFAIEAIHETWKIVNVWRVFKIAYCVPIHVSVP